MALTGNIPLLEGPQAGPIDLPPSIPGLTLMWVGFPSLPTRQTAGAP